MTRPRGIAARATGLIIALGALVVAGSGASAGELLQSSSAPAHPALRSTSAGLFPARSLALGDPVSHSEASAFDGVVASRVPAESGVVADELLVTVRSGTRGALLQQIQSQRALTVVGWLPDVPVVLLRVRHGERQPIVDWLRGLSMVTSVQSDTIERPVGLACTAGSSCSIPNDQGFSYQWYLYNQPGAIQPPGAGVPIYGDDVDAVRAWSRTRGSAAVKIAVVDTGIDATHPDLAGKVIAAANFTSSTTTQDLSGHGTHVAGIAAASFDNALGIAGMAPNARLMDVKVLAVDADGQTTGDCADVADGVVWATDHGANVLNLSLGSEAACSALQLAVEYAASHGALVVAAAGNAGTTKHFYPAAFPGVLSVAATTNQDRLAGFSNRDASWVDVAAPGDGIVSTLPTYDNGTGAVDYGYLSGTSMAAPIVSGIAALIWSQMPAATARQDVETRIFDSADRIAGTGVDFRYGRVDACQAVTGDALACGESPAAPTPSPTTSSLPPQTTSPPPAAPTSPPPPQIAEPAPIVTSTPAAPHVNAHPGAYAGSLRRNSGTLQLIVGDGGDALIRLQGTVRLSCSGVTRRVRISTLSTTQYGQIRSDG
ncbi:MAG TPA: S8 family serine peptidase, partial [Acidothermaceae bacterium]|nr:S8 family serine peptidase [Acidothermaceae bacterium]